MWPKNFPTPAHVQHVQNSWYFFLISLLISLSITLETIAYLKYINNKYVLGSKMLLRIIIFTIYFTDNTTTSYPDWRLASSSCWRLHENCSEYCAWRKSCTRPQWVCPFLTHERGLLWPRDQVSQGIIKETAAERQGLAFISVLLFPAVYENRVVHLLTNSGLKKNCTHLMEILQIAIYVHM